MTTVKFSLSPTLKRGINQWVKKFPKGKQASAVLMALRLVQDAHGHLQDQHLDAVAEYLSMPKIQVYEVASFYSMFRREPAGKHVLSVCGSISCYLRDANGVIETIQEKLGIGMNQTTPCGQFSLKEVECLGACCGAPCMLVGDHEYHTDMNPKKVCDLIDKLDKEKQHG